MIKCSITKISYKTRETRKKEGCIYTSGFLATTSVSLFFSCYYYSNQTHYHTCIHTYLYTYIHTYTNSTFFYHWPRKSKDNKTQCS